MVISDLVNNFIADCKSNSISLFTITNGNCVATITNYGARLVHFWVKQNEKEIDIIVGPKTANHFLHYPEMYYGAIVGPNCNRIANGTFTLHNQLYLLDKNNSPNNLHSGEVGFHNKYFTLEEKTNNSVTLSYYKKENVFPGDMKIMVCYYLTNANELKIEIKANTNKAALINITNHAYYNLNGFGNILNHSLQIVSNEYLPINENHIPNGVYEKVAGTVFDFTSSKKIGTNILDANQQLKIGNGYDHNFILKKINSSEINLAAVAKGDISGIEMQLSTNQVGLQLYSGNYLNEDNLVNNNQPDMKHGAFCLETQAFPNAVNESRFPTAIITANEEYNNTTILKIIT